MTVQTDLATALGAYINSGVFQGSLSEISADKRNLEELLEILQSLSTGGGGGASITNYATETGGNLESINTKLPALSSGAIPVTLPTAQIAPQPKVKELTAATLTRAANTTPYSIGDSYGGRGVFTSVGTIGQSLFINDFQVIIDITLIPTSMAMSVRFFTTEADTLVTGSPVADNSLLTATFPNTATPADGYPLTISVIGDKVFAVAKNIKFITPLESTSIWFYLRCNAAFTPAANSETLTAKASCEVY